MKIISWIKKTYRRLRKPQHPAIEVHIAGWTPNPGNAVKIGGRDVLANKIMFEWQVGQPPVAEVRILPRMVDVELMELMEGMGVKILHELPLILCEDNLIASEALYGFCSWLTTRPEVVTVSEKHEAGHIADLVERFCKANGLTEPRDGWAENLVHPEG